MTCDKNKNAIWARQAELSQQSALERTPGNAKGNAWPLLP